MFHVEQFEAVENLLRHLVGFEPSAIRQEFMRNAHLWKMSGQVIVPRGTPGVASSLSKPLVPHGTSDCRLIVPRETILRARK